MDSSMCEEGFRVELGEVVSNLFTFILLSVFFLVNVYHVLGVDEAVPIVAGGLRIEYIVTER